MLEEEFKETKSSLPIQICTLYNLNTTGLTSHLVLLLLLQIYHLIFLDLLYKDSAIPQGHYCQGREDLVVVCSTCLTGVCIKQCCPPGQVRVEDRAWTQPRCAEEEEVRE